LARVRSYFKDVPIESLRVSKTGHTREGEQNCDRNPKHHWRSDKEVEKGKEGVCQGPHEHAEVVELGMSETRE